MSQGGVERTFDPDELIVSKTDLRGVITYANQVFCRVAGYDVHELLGKPHSIVRHPDMPRAVFKLLWDELEAGREVFAYVKNLCKDGADYYWVLAHVTPTCDAQGRAIGYHSNRRVPARKALAAVEPLYAALLAEEQRHRDRKAGLRASWELLQETLRTKEVAYPQLVWSLTPESLEPAGGAR